MNNILLSNLTEYQKSLLTRLAYLNVDYNRFQKVKEMQTKITISDLKFLLSDPNDSYLGCLHLPQLKKAITGVTTTNMEFVEEIENSGLGELEVVDLANDLYSGFNGICFKDSMRNVGFSFRGTDPKTFYSLATDGLADVEAFLTNHTEQVDEAQALFDKHKNYSSKNYLYGHSLGGFLAESIYLQNHKDVSNAFVINPLHVNSQSLDTKEKIDAINNKEKFSCFVSGGDYVSSINKPELFADNVHYVRNNKENVNNPIGNHLVEACEFDETGSLVQCSKEEAFEGHEIPLATSAINVINNKKIKGFFSKAFLTSKKWFFSITSRLENFFKNRKALKAGKEKTPDETEQNGLDKYIVHNDETGKNVQDTSLKNNDKTLSHSGSKDEWQR